MCNSEKMVRQTNIFPMENCKKRRFILKFQLEIGNKDSTIIDTFFQPFTEKPNSPIEVVLEFDW